VDERLLKFACSLSWRVLTYYRLTTPMQPFSVEQHAEAGVALEKWRSYLLGECQHPGRYEHHVLMMDRLESSTVPELPGNINRYLLRSVDMDLVAGRQTSFVYV